MQAVTHGISSSYDICVKAALALAGKAVVFNTSFFYKPLLLQPCTVASIAQMLVSCGRLFNVIQTVQKSHEYCQPLTRMIDIKHFLGLQVTDIGKKAYVI